MSLKLKLNLKAKTLWIPVLLIVTAYLLIAVTFSGLILSNAKTTLNNELTSLIDNAKKQLQAGLSLVTSSQLPADAFLGLDGGDDELAKDLNKQVSALGLDDVFITDLKGEMIYSETDKEGDEYNSKFGTEFKSFLMNSSKQKDDVNIVYLNGHIVGFAPIMDVETPTGFLVFAIDIPNNLAEMTAALMSSHSNSAETEDSNLISAHLLKVYDLANTNSKNFFNKVYLTMAAILIPSLLLLIYILGTSASKIIRRMHRLLDAFHKQAAGDLTREVHVKSKDEIADLTDTFNSTNRNLHDMVSKIVTNSESLAASSSQLSATAESITSDALDQKEKTDHVARSMEELSVTFLEVSRNTSSASTSANEANDLAIKGGEVVVKTVSGMNRIAASVKESSQTVEALGERSEQIGQIIAVINDIAGQTNLLALNAAIEAARAGEQGRGFAVVADEVRKLAERTTSATNEIGEMIKGIQDDTGKAVESMHSGTKEVEEGVKLSSEAGDALEKIVSSVQNVTDMIQQISAAVEEQSSASDEIITSICDVATITNKNTDNAQASSESILQLNSMASELHNMVSTFKLRNKTDLKKLNNKSSVETGHNIKPVQS